MKDARAIREGRKGLHAQVNAGFLASLGKGCMGTSAQEKQTYQPSASRLIVMVLGAPSTDATTHGETPDFGEDQKAVIQRRPIAELFVGEGVVARRALIAREARLLASHQSAKERLVGFVESRQHILQDVAMDGGVPWERSADSLQLCLLLKA